MEYTVEKALAWLILSGPQPVGMLSKSMQASDTPAISQTPVSLAAAP